MARAKSDGKNAMKHAVATLRARGFTRFQTAGKRVVRTPDGRMFTAAEDLFGCFDVIAVGSRKWAKFIQVTTETKSGGSVYSRKKKIEQEFLDGVANAPLAFHVEVWSWVRRTGFRRWSFEPVLGEWHEKPILPSPLLKAKRSI